MTTKLKPADLDRCVGALPAPLQELLKQRGSSVVVAGGFVRACVGNEKASDIDLFVPSKDMGLEIANALDLALNSGKYSIRPAASVHESSRAFTVRNQGHPIQIIHRWVFPDPQAVIDSFDFTIAKAAVWWNGSEWD